MKLSRPLIVHSMVATLDVGEFLGGLGRKGKKQNKCRSAPCSIDRRINNSPPCALSSHQHRAPSRLKVLLHALLVGKLTWHQYIFAARSSRDCSTEGAPYR